MFSSTSDMVIINNGNKDITIPIIVALDHGALKKFLKRARDKDFTKASYRIIGPPCSMTTNLLESYGIRPLPLKSPSRSLQQKILEEYNHVMGLMAQANGHDIHWWATDTASKNRFVSPLSRLLNDWISCLQAINSLPDNQSLLILAYPMLSVIHSLKSSAKSCHWNLKIISSFGTEQIMFLKGKLGAWAGLFKEFILSSVWIIQARRHFGRNISGISKKDPLVLIKSFAYENSFKLDGEYVDPFFGKLTELVSPHLPGNINIMTVSVAFNNRSECYRKMRLLKNHTVVPLEVFLNFKDLLRGIISITWGRLVRPFKVPRFLPFGGHNISELISTCLNMGGWKLSLYQYLHLAAARRIAQTYSVKACTMTFESNPWEKMFIKGLIAAHNKPFITGYQHSVIPMSAAGMFVTRYEMENNMPLPDHFLTTGNIPSEILKRYSDIPPDKITSAGAFRYSYLRELSPFERSRNKFSKFRVLVALEGVMDVLPMVLYVFKQAKKHPSISFCVRSHPVLPLERILRLTGMNSDKDIPVVLSEGGAVSNDVKECDAVLYWGTTVSLEAVMMGRPVIHFDRGDALSYDPLSDLTDFKWQVSGDDDIRTVVSEIESLSNEDYVKRQETAINFIHRYFFTDIDDNSLECFFGPIIIADQLLEGNMT